MTVTLANTPVLHSARLTLRAPIASDWPHWSAFAGSDRSQYISGPYAPKAAWRAFGHAIGHWVMRGFGSFVFTLKEDDTPLGMAGPWFPEGWPEAEIGWTIWSPEAEGQGYAHEAARAALDHAFTSLGWTTAVSYIDEPNLRSIALAERLGAVRDPSAEIPDFDEDVPRVLAYRHSPQVWGSDSGGGMEAYA